MYSYHKFQRRRGYTLIELLVVLAIVAMLIGLILPALLGAREAAHRMTCQSHLRQLGIASHHFHDARGQFPTGARPPVNVGDRPTGGTNLWVELLPYFEQNNLYQQWDYNDNRNNVAGGKNATQAQVIPILICPSDVLSKPVTEFTVALAPRWSWGLYGMSSYGGNAGKRSWFPGDGPAFPLMTRDGIFFIDSSVRLADITDGGSNTFLYGERFHHDPEYDRRGRIVWPELASITTVGKWGIASGGPGIMGNVTLSTPAPINYQMPPWGDHLAVEDRLCAFGSGHPGGANFAFADGSVRFLRDRTPLPILQALSTRQSREVAPLP